MIGSSALEGPPIIINNKHNKLVSALKEKFLSLIVMAPQIIIYDGTKSNVENGTVTLAKILSFITGLRQIPPLGLKENGLRNLDTKIYPMADACLNKIKLPTCHQNRDNFFSKMDEGIYSQSRLPRACNSRQKWRRE